MTPKDPAAPRFPRPLTERQRRFVREYLTDGNAAAAAVRAGYSPIRADSQGHRLKNLPWVRAAIEAELAAKTRPTDRERSLAELRRIAFADITDFLAWDGTGVHLKPMDALTREQTACVAEIVETSGKAGKLLRVKLHGKLTALASLLRETGREEDRQPDGTGPRPVIVLTQAPEPRLPPDEGEGEDEDKGEDASGGQEGNHSPPGLS